MAIDHDSDTPGEEPFGLHAERVGSTYRVELRGEFDLAAVPAVEAALARAWDGGVELLDIDLGGLAFLDSSGVRTLLETRERAARHGVRLQLRRGVEAVQRVFAITGLEATLPFTDEPCA